MSFLYEYFKKNINLFEIEFSKNTSLMLVIAKNFINNSKKITPEIELDFKNKIRKYLNYSFPIGYQAKEIIELLNQKKKLSFNYLYKSFIRIINSASYYKF